MEIFQRFMEIVGYSKVPVIFEFGTCDGQHTNIMCNILKQMNKNFRYYAFEADPRIVPAFWKVNANHQSVINFVQAAIGSIDGEVTFNLSGGEEKRPGHFQQAFYGSSSIRTPKKTLEYWPDMTFEQAQVKSYRFDTMYSQFQPGIIDFIWCDIQGAEGDLIDGGQVALANTRYLYTEYSNDELYEGEIGLEEIMKRLPGKWSIVEDYGSDILLKNENL